MTRGTPPGGRPPPSALSHRRHDPGKSGGPRRIHRTSISFWDARPPVAEKGKGGALERIGHYGAFTGLHCRQRGPPSRRAVGFLRTGRARGEKERGKTYSRRFGVSVPVAWTQLRKHRTTPPFRAASDESRLDPFSAALHGLLPGVAESSCGFPAPVGFTSLTRAQVSVLFTAPQLVGLLDKGFDSLSQLGDVAEGLFLQDLLFQRPEEPLDNTVGFRLLEERKA